MCVESVFRCEGGDLDEGRLEMGLMEKGRRSREWAY